MLFINDESDNYENNIENKEGEAMKNNDSTEKNESIEKTNKKDDNTDMEIICEKNEELEKENIDNIDTQEIPDDYLHFLLSKSILFRDRSKQTFIMVNIDDTNRIFRITSKEFKSYIACLYYDYNGEPLPKKLQGIIIDLFDNIACTRGEIVRIDIRCVWDRRSIVYDLYNESHDAICISRTGWDIIKVRKPLFKGYQHQLTQVHPTRDGSIDNFIELLNVDEDDRRLVKAYIVAAFIPWFPHPILKIEGEKGSAKTTAIKLLKALIDPSKIQNLSLPKDAREMVQQLDHHYFIGYDNLSKIPRWASDTLCRAVSGDGYSSRTLYTSDEDTIRSFIRCLSINGLDMGALQDDLLDRCLIINFKRISEENRKTEAEIRSRFEEILPGTLGSIFQIISDAMKIYSSITLPKTYRLADFIKWGCAISSVLEGECGIQNFIDDYQRMVDKQEDASIDDNVLLTSINYFFEKHDNWIGTSTQLFNTLSEICACHKLDTKHESWPKAPNYMSKKIKSYQALLRGNGFSITFPPRSATNRKIHVQKLSGPVYTDKREVIKEQNETTTETVN